MGKISVVINTLNEELRLPFTLSSIKGFGDEIIVVDMKSDDDTVKVAKTFGAKVYKHARTGYVEPARNFAIKKASGDWILIIDADERLTPKLKRKLKSIVENPEADFYRLPRKNIIFGKWIKHSRWWPDYNIRFFRKGSVYWSEIIHSVPETYGKGLDLPPNEKYAIYHDHYRTIDEYIERMNRYTFIKAKDLVNQKYRFQLSDLIKKPTSEFLTRYFAGEGYKDGVHGLALASLQAFSELVLYLKIWRLSPLKKDPSATLADTVRIMEKAQSEVNYWKAHVLLKEGGGLIQRIKRRFKLP